MISLFAAPLAAVALDWKTRPLADFLAEAPGGRLAAMLAGDTASRERPAAEALAGKPGADKRALFDALVEDRATACLWDAPDAALAKLWPELPALLAKAEKAEHGEKLVVVSARPKAARPAEGGDLAADLGEALAAVAEAASQPGFTLLGRRG